MISNKENGIIEMQSNHENQIKKDTEKKIVLACFFASVGSLLIQISMMLGLSKLSFLLLFIPTLFLVLFGLLKAMLLFLTKK